MTSLQGHFEAALALIIKNLEDMQALQESLRDLGAQHVHWGAKPQDYFTVRDAIVRAIRSASTVVERRARGRPAPRHHRDCGADAARPRRAHGDRRRGNGSRVVRFCHEGWTRHFEADPNIVGRTIFINEAAFTVVGITPQQFAGTASPVIPRMYATWQAVQRPSPELPRGYMIGRLSAGATLRTAQADFARVAAQMRRDKNQPVSVAVYAATASMPGTQRVFSIFATLFMVIVGSVLWAACSNVAILQLVRSSARRREMAIRLAIGATRPQLVRQLLIENLLLALVAGTVGISLALATARWLTQIQLPVPMPIGLPSFDPDWRVGLFAIALSVVASLLSGLGAALDARLTSASEVLRHEAFGTSGAFSRQSLIIVQVALTTVLLVVAVAMTRSVVTPPDYGLDANGVLIASVALPRAQYSADEVRPFLDRLVGAAKSSPGVISASLVETIQYRTTAHSPSSTSTSTSQPPRRTVSYRARGCS